MSIISIIVPCFNEAPNISALKNALDNVLKDFELEFLFIDDGSTDNTLDILKLISAKDDRVKYISFSRNFGHQNALKAGIDNANGDCLISMDADMQHKPEIIIEMLEKWKEGYDIVFTIPENDHSLPFLKRFTSKVFYTFFSYFSNTESKHIGSDFRLMDRKIADVLKSDFSEYFLFYRGIISWMGYKQFGIHYKPGKRIYGKSKYSYNKMCRLASDGITSFSIKPLRFITFAGIMVSALAFLYGLYALYIAFFTDKAITGWTSVILSVLFIGGLQLLFLGVIGEYLGKMFFEIKKRPNYLIKSKNF